MIPKTLYKSQFGLIATLLYTIIFAIFINLELISYFCISLDIPSFLERDMFFSSLGILFPIRTYFMEIIRSPTLTSNITIFIINTIFFYFSGAILETVLKHKKIHKKPLRKFLIILLIITILFIFIYKSL